MTLEKVTRLRKLLSEATPVDTPAAHAPAEPWRHAQHLEALQAQATPPIDTSWRGVTTRNITRIATWYGWTQEIQRVLDSKGAAHLACLDDSELTALHERFAQLEDCAQNGFGPPDAPIPQ